MRILITNNTLGRRAGSELYVRDIALALLRRGHHPVAYSTQLGAVADELRAATIPVIDDLTLLKATPDVIHGQHHLDAMTAMLRFPDTPAVYFCHGWLPWEEMAAHFPTIHRYVAVDDLCLERLQCVHGILPERIRVIRNFVDLERFPLRSELPATPRRALAFSNYLREDGCLGLLRQACAARGIELDAIGLSVGRIEDRPEQLLAQYDIVFAKARCALEALASGTAVVTCDVTGLGGMVTPDNYESFRRLNFGIRSLRKPITIETISRELEQFDPARAREVSLRVRSEAGIEQAVDQILAVYQEAIASHSEAPPTKESQLQAASVYLRQVADFTKGRYAAEEARSQAQAECTVQRARADRAEKSEQTLALIRSSRLWPLITLRFRVADAIKRLPGFRSIDRRDLPGNSD
jgi:Glycosyltransferase Family 4